MGWWELSTKYADGSDKCLLFAALLGTALMSGSGPLFAIVWGGATDEINDSQTKKGMDLDPSIGYFMAGVGTLMALG